LICTQVFRPFGTYLTHPHPFSFEKEKGDAIIVLFHCSPSLFLTHPQLLSFEKERGDGYYSTHHYFPLFNPVREGE